MISLTTAEYNALLEELQYALESSADVLLTYRARPEEDLFRKVILNSFRDVLYGMENYLTKYNTSEAHKVDDCGLYENFRKRACSLYNAYAERGFPQNPEVTAETKDNARSYFGYPPSKWNSFPDWYRGRRISEYLRETVEERIPV